MNLIDIIKLQESSNETPFLEKMKSKYGIEVSEPVKKIIKWVRNNHLDVKFSGKQDMSCYPSVYHNGSH